MFVQLVHLPFPKLPPPTCLIHGMHHLEHDLYPLSYHHPSNSSIDQIGQAKASTHTHLLQLQLCRLQQAWVDSVWPQRRAEVPQLGSDLPLPKHPPAQQSQHTLLLKGLLTAQPHAVDKETPFNCASTHSQALDFFRA